MVDLLMPGDRAIVDVRGDIQTWRVCHDPQGGPYDKVAERNDRYWRVWFDGRNYRVGQHRVIART
jgi:hypothetical protein